MIEAPTQLGKLFVIIGFVLVVLGLVLIFGSRFGFLGMGRLPGDIAYKGKNVAFYFPVVTCLLISAFLTGVLWILSYLSRR